MDTEGQAPTNPMNGGTGDKRKGLFYHNIAPNGVGTASTGTVLYVNRLFRGFNRLLTIIVDASQGVASIKDGSIELMVC